MMVLIRKEIYYKYQKHKIDLNSYLQDIIVYLSLEHCKNLEFDFVTGCNELNSVEVELDDDIITELNKFFGAREDYNKIVNIIALTGLMFGGVI
ncbi:MAG: hypothetical protein GYA02_15215 [Clostridiaceae bacterium]|nr:hypothetical protein [Clostridiaceae bacterium]